MFAEFGVKWKYVSTRILKPGCRILATMNEQKFPPGWNDERVREVIAHYENETEDEQFAEIEAAREADGVTIMAVPTDLVPEVRALIARKGNG